MEDDALDNAQLHALHWAFFSSVMDKDFPELFAEFVTWCDNLSKEEMDSIFSDDEEDMEDSQEETPTYTEDEIWKSLSVN
jgi:hypothetical protein